MKIRGRKRKYIFRWRKQWVWGKRDIFRFYGPIVLEVRKRG